jgi:hypothetical protein
LKIDCDVDTVFERLLLRLKLPTPPPYHPDEDPFKRRVVPTPTPTDAWTFATASAHHKSVEEAGTVEVNTTPGCG